ncbi:15376_t:CDS:2 [Funneliformis caledonium]|uniref:15376_t:CDS:1 n=1 Tax=Funneliformis caledonium TaxID=1117310 RepID=A0A9N9FLP4_9GLOM|nr:15376_t:CDS:2 [Funneliformis caledonium]
MNKEDLDQILETIQSPSSINISYDNCDFPGNNDLITKVDLNNSAEEVSDHLSQINKFENSTSSNVTDVQHHVTYSSRISSPLKLSFIPETINESEEESQVNSNAQIDNSGSNSSVHDVDGEVFNQSTFSNLTISEEPEGVSHNEDTLERKESRKDSLFEPINRLKELMNSQPPVSDNPLEPLESNTEVHSSQDALPVENLVPASIDTDKNTDVVLSIKFRKGRVAPEALNSFDIKQIKNQVQRTNAYAAKLNSLKRETTGLQKWISTNIGKEPPLIVKNYKKRSHRTSTTLNNSSININKIYSNPALAISTSSQPSLSTVSSTNTENSADISFTNSNTMSSDKTARSSTSRNSLDLAIQASSLRGRPISPPLSPRSKTPNFLNITRHNSFSKSNRLPIFMPPAVMNDPSANSPTSPTSSSKISKTVSIKPRQRRFSFQSVSSRFSLGSSTPTFPTAIKENNDPSLSNSNSIEVDETALNKLCDIIPQADREVLSKYLHAAGGKDDLMAVGLYMKDFKNDKISC